MMMPLSLFVVYVMDDDELHYSLMMQFSFIA